VQEVCKGKRRNIRTNSAKAKGANVSYEQTFNAYNCRWMHKHFRALLRHLLTIQPTAVPLNVLKDMLVCFNLLRQLASSGGNWHRVCLNVVCMLC
jgi:hypothetical protein